MESMLFKTVHNRLPPIDSLSPTCPCWNDIEGRLVKQKKAANHLAASIFHPVTLVIHEGDLPHQAGVHRLVGCGVVKQVAQNVAAGFLLLALPTENISDL